MTEPTYEPRHPRYIDHDGAIYMRKDHVADQLRIAIELAFADGMKFAGAVPVKRGPRRPYKRRISTVEAVAT